MFEQRSDLDRQHKCEKGSLISFGALPQLHSCKRHECAVAHRKCVNHAYRHKEVHSFRKFTVSRFHTHTTVVYTGVVFWGHVSHACEHHPSSQVQFSDNAQSQRKLPAATIRCSSPSKFRLQPTRAWIGHRYLGDSPGRDDRSQFGCLPCTFAQPQCWPDSARVCPCQFATDQNRKANSLLFTFSYHPRHGITRSGVHGCGCTCQ